jgi:hypothetical protein
MKSETGVYIGASNEENLRLRRRQVIQEQEHRIRVYGGAWKSDYAGGATGT